MFYTGFSFFAYFTIPIMKGCEMCEDQNVNPTVDDFSTMRNLGGRTTWVVTVDYPGQRKNLKLLTTQLGQTSSFSFLIFRRFDRGYYGAKMDRKVISIPARGRTPSCL